MVSFLGRTDVREVRCRVTDTHTQTDPTTVTLAAHARRGLIKQANLLAASHEDELWDLIYLIFVLCVVARWACC